MSDPVFAVVGAGPVGTGLARVLVEAGMAVAGIASRQTASARSAARFAGCPWLSSLEEAITEADWIILATPDSAISEIVASLGRRRVPWLSHLSGALPASVLRPASHHAVSLHPCASLPDRDTASARLRTCWYGLEGEEEAMVRAESLLARLGAKSFRITGDKALYHAGACVASNYVVTLASAAESLWEQAGVPADARPALYELMAGTVDNIRQQGAEAALTGPIKRHEVETVARHLEAMREHQVPWSRLYRSVGRETLRLAPDDALDGLLKESDD